MYWYKNRNLKLKLKCRIGCIHAKSLCGIGLFATLWTVACQAPLSMGFFWQEYSSGLPFPTPGALPDPGNVPVSH